MYPIDWEGHAYTHCRRKFVLSVKVAPIPHLVCRRGFVPPTFVPPAFVIMRFGALLVLMGSPVVTGRYMSSSAVTGQRLVTSTCDAHFATLCAIQRAHEVVDEVIGVLMAADAQQEASVLANVSDGLLNREYNFWPSVFDESGAYVACGRPALGNTSRGSTLTGQQLEAVATAEAGTDQVGLWERVRAAAADDGHFVHAGLDLFHANDYANDAVTRIGRVRAVDTNSGRRLFVVSSYSDKTYAKLAATQPCDDKYDAPCSTAYARKVLGQVTDRHSSFVPTDLQIRSSRVRLLPVR